jgi:hypothetical protein
LAAVNADYFSRGYSSSLNMLPLTLLSHQAVAKALAEELSADQEVDVTIQQGQTRATICSGFNLDPTANQRLQPAIRENMSGRNYLIVN